MVLVPALGKEGDLAVDRREEEEMKEPNMADIIDIKPISQLEDGERSDQVAPSCTVISTQRCSILML
jgi:hypothetical protein